jgi:outer membrane protein TolC
VERARTIDRIRAEVAEAHALAAARRQEMELARKRIDLAQRAYTQDLARIRNREGLPLEVLQSANQLKDARQDLVRSMIGYSQAQLRLFAALGNAPR